MWKVLEIKKKNSHYKKYQKNKKEKWEREPIQKSQTIFLWDKPTEIFVKIYTFQQKDWESGGWQDSCRIKQQGTLCKFIKI